MKIAVQFYGHLRTYQKCFPSVQRLLLDKYDCDVFMHTWSETEHQTKTWHNYKMKTIQKVDETIVKELKEIYHLKEILVEEQQQSDEQNFIRCLHNDKSVISINGINFMLYSQRKVNELRQEYQKKTGICYDYVLVLRPDIMLYKELNFNLLDKEIKTAKNQITRFCGINPLPMNEFALALDSATDTLYCSSPVIIDKTIQILNNIQINDYQEEVWNPENLFNRVLLENGIVSTPMLYIRARDWNIIRENTLIPVIKETKKSKNKLIRFRLSYKKLYLKLFPNKKPLFNMGVIVKDKTIFQFSWGKYE